MLVAAVAAAVVAVVALVAVVAAVATSVNGATPMHNVAVTAARSGKIPYLREGRG